MRPSNFITASAFLCGTATGCVTLPDYDGADPAATGPNRARDKGQYVALQRELDEGRREVLGEYADELYAAGNVLYWLNFSQFTPTLSSYQDGTVTDYDFSIGDANGHSFRASGDLVATAVVDGESIRYELYAPGAPAQSLGEAIFDAPGGEQRWWAYAVDRSSLFVMTSSEVTTLYRYDANAAAPVVVTTLQSAGCDVGELWAFGVDGDTTYLIESGRLWHLDTATNTCTFMGNETQIAGAVNFERDGVLWEESTGPFFFDNAARTTIDVAQAIADSDYRLNESYDSIHHWNYDLTRFQDWAIYIGNSGVYGHQLYTGEVKPILMEPFDVDARIQYRYPVVTDDGMLFVTGLSGADGPVYSVDLNGRL